MKLVLSNYRVYATDMATGEQVQFEIEALDAGEALHKVERGGAYAADDAVLVEEA